jgi:hypothetical protein
LYDDFPMQREGDAIYVCAEKTWEDKHNQEGCDPAVAFCLSMLWWDRQAAVENKKGRVVGAGTVQSSFTRVRKPNRANVVQAQAE